MKKRVEKRGLSTCESQERAKVFGRMVREVDRFRGVPTVEDMQKIAQFPFRIADVRGLFETRSVRMTQSGKPISRRGGRPQKGQGVESEEMRIFHDALRTIISYVPPEHREKHRLSRNT